MGALLFEKPALSSMNDKTLVELIKPNHGEKVKLDVLSDDERATLARLMGKARPRATDPGGGVACTR